MVATQLYHLKCLKIKKTKAGLKEMYKGGLVKTLLYIKNSNISDSFSETVKLLMFLNSNNYTYVYQKEHFNF